MINQRDTKVSLSEQSENARDTNPESCSSGGSGRNTNSAVGPLIEPAGKTGTIYVADLDTTNDLGFREFWPNERV